MTRKSSKDAILDATERVLTQKGYSRTTLDAIAAEAGVSKGGLFYHFATKLDLIRTLLQRYDDRSQQWLRECAEDLPPTPGRNLKAYILARLTKHPPLPAGNPMNVFTVIEEAGVRAYIETLKKRYIAFLTQDGIPLETVITVMMTIEGMWMFQLFATPPLSSEMRDKVIRQLLTFVDQAESRLAPTAGAAPR